MSRSFMRLFSVLIVGFLVAACSSDSSPGSGAPTVGGSPTDTDAPAADATEFVEGFCDSMASFQQDIQDESTSFQGDMSTATPQEALEALATFLGVVAERAQQTADEIAALGVPDVEGGEQVASTLVSGLEQLADLFETTKADVEALPADDPAALADGLQEMGDNLGEASTAIGDAFAELDDVDLGIDPEDVPSCAA